MSLGLLSADPSAVIFDTITAQLPGIQIGYDMPPGDVKLFLTLSAGAPPTMLTQRWTLTLSAYASNGHGVHDHAKAQSIWADAARAVLAARHRFPLCDAQVQSGPIVNHDARLDIDYVYGSIILTVACGQETQ